ncbi:hypothetical protein ACFU6I_43210, partial [Streptomyces sp. NPDC057486]|uniref:hypothetical protein n=1 Tax=Streptomyces sp. NPDC057486 TaxID=3346145 RepID=UPI0036CCA17D
SGGSNLTRLFFVSVSGPNLIPVAFGVAFAFRRVRYFSRFPWQLIIEPLGSITACRIRTRQGESKVVVGRFRVLNLGPMDRADSSTRSSGSDYVR